MADSSVIGVLTGDLKNSSDLDAETLAFARGEVAAAVDAVRATRGEAVAAGPEFFRGDSWQLALNDAGLALRAALLVRARLRTRAQTDTRIGIGIGTVERLDEARVSLSTGEAFALSGGALDTIGPRDPDLIAALPTSMAELERWVNATLTFCDAVVGNWSQSQALHIALSLEHLEASQEEIGAMCSPPITQQTVKRSLDRGGWRAVLTAMHAFETTRWST